MMKKPILLLCSALFLAGCAGVHVSKTYVATGATHPRSIYIRPFSVSQCDFSGHHRNLGERPIRRSLAPREFADALQEELSKIAPAMVLANDEVPRTGWLVTGDLEVVNAGNPARRFFFGWAGAGRSHVLIHVRVIDVGHHSARLSDKKEIASSTSYAQSSRLGDVIYEFDLTGGSRGSGKLGSIYAPGLGYATPFDFRNAAERVMFALSTDPDRYGIRNSPTIH